MTNPNGASHDPREVNHMNNPNNGAAHMNETNTPAPTLEGTEADLANLDPKTANILRRRMGLAVVETEPSGEREEERERLAAFRQQLAEMFPTPRVIDRTALELLDAEITENARRKAEEEAAEAAKRAARERRESEAVTAALEPLKARSRALSPVKRRVIESSVQIAASLPDDIVFQHSVLCQTVLPYRDPGPEVRKWEREQGKVRLQITAGEVDDKRNRKFVPVGLPYGPTARLILTYLNTQALRTQNRVIDTHDSLTAFVRRLQGFNPNGQQIVRTKEQLIRLSVCNIRMAFHAGDGTGQINTQIVGGLNLWEERHDGQSFMFPKQIALSYEYAESLLAHAVPLDERAVAALAHSAMALDIYAWLAQRLHRVDPQRGQVIRWTSLHAQFGQGYKQLKFFRRDFKTALTQVLTQYPAARVKTDKGGMLLGHSPPPVPSRHVILLPPAKTTKG